MAFYLDGGNAVKRIILQIILSGRLALAHGHSASTPTSPTINVSNLGEILSKSIYAAINTIVLIGGFIVLFSVIISILQNSKLLFMLSKTINPFLAILGIPSSFSNGLITGIIELTNGVSVVSTIPNRLISTNIIICSFLIGLGRYIHIIPSFKYNL